MSEIEVEGPDGAILAFPADTPRDVMRSALAKRYPAQQAATQPQGGQPSTADSITRGLLSRQPQPAPERPSAMMDIAKTIPSGLARGVAGAAGMMGAIERGVYNGGSWLLGNEPREYQNRFPTSEQIQSGMETVIGSPLYTPQTTAGRYANRAAEFIPGALAGPGGMVRNAINYGIVPGLASEAAGQMTEGSAVEPWARGAAAIGTGLAAGMLNTPSASSGAVSRATQGANPQQIDAAEQLFQQAQQMGTPITRFEALQRVTNNGTRAGDMQRVIEGQGGLRDFFAERGARNAQAAGNVFDTIAPPTANPSGIGPAMGQAAQQTLTDVRQGINRATDPLYKAAETQIMPAADMQRIMAAPGWNEARAAVRSDPQLNRTVANLPDDSIGFLNEVKKYLDTQGKNAAGQFNPQANQQRAAGYGMDAATVREAATQASPEYAQALAAQEAARSKYLEPLMQGPLGKLAQRDPTTQQAIETLFPRNPMAGSADEVATAVSAIAKRNPNAARDAVRAYSENLFNQTTRNLQSGENQFGGASFAAAFRGNPQQWENFTAAVSALPNGQDIVKGMDKFLTILEAQGTRQRVGSQTAFNQEIQQQLKGGSGLTTGAAIVGGAGITWPRKAMDALEALRLGRNVDQLARLVTDPNAATSFRALANTNSASATTGHAIRLLMLGNRAGLQPVQNHDGQVGQ